MPQHKHTHTHASTRPRRTSSPRNAPASRAERFSVSLAGDLLAQLDATAHRQGYHNRSLLIADMVRAWLVEHAQHPARRLIVGTITLVYDHHKPNLQRQLTGIQHDHHADVTATLHVHLDHHHCLEVLAVRGRAAQVQQLADALIGVKGVKHGKLTVTTTGRQWS